ncbi:hypothetical protein EON67_11440 [archaeon]|nr:MAG: hypothetical protein EON67_11440 [archaeon]
MRVPGGRRGQGGSDRAAAAGDATLHIAALSQGATPRACVCALLAEGARTRKPPTSTGGHHCMLHVPVVASRHVRALVDSQAWGAHVEAGWTRMAPRCRCCCTLFVWRGSCSCCAHPAVGGCVLECSHTTRSPVTHRW